MKKQTITYLTIISGVIVLSLPLLTLADTPTFSSLVSLPGPAGGALDGNASFDEFINGLYAISISIAALLAVIKIIIAGVKWMLTDVITSKGEAKKDIEGSLIGLLVVLGAVLILTVINSDIVNVDLSFQRLAGTENTGGGGSEPTLTAHITNLGSGVSYISTSEDSTQQGLFSTQCTIKQNGAIRGQGGKIFCFEGKRYALFPNNSYAPTYCADMVGKVLEAKTGTVVDIGDGMVVCIIN